MRCMLQTKCLFFVLLVAILLSGCASNAVQTTRKEKRPPLPIDVPVSFIYGPVTPIIPETAEYVTTIETNYFNGGCSVETIIPYLERRAHDLGANLVFVKRAYKTVSEYTNPQVCHRFLVDFLADFPGGQNEN